MTTNPNRVPFDKLDLADNGDLIFTRDGEDQVVRAARCFPWTHPDEFIVLRQDKEDGEEVAILEDLRKLPANARGAVEAWLQQHTLIPKVTRVLACREINAARLFHVETDRGERRFKIVEREDIRSLDDGRTLLRDNDGNTYELPPVDEMDKASQRELSSVL
ncbi:MAG: DUF1854 domain-containing protein [Planctomycetota bacterium]